MTARPEDSSTQAEVPSCESFRPDQSVPAPDGIKDPYELGDMPPLGHVPVRMHASTIRQERYGVPRDAFAVEVFPVPCPCPRHVLDWVMAAGVNYNNVRAGLGKPIDVIGARQRRGRANESFHIGGSDASGIVWSVGSEVDDLVGGDEVVLSCGMWDESAPDIHAGADPSTSSTTRLWGYEVKIWSSASKQLPIMLKLQ